MPMTPQDVEAQVFREKFKGYDQDEVDEFLDRVSDTLGELQRDRDELVERLQRVEADAAESIEAERLLKRTLITAQRTADETVAEAVAQANSTIAEADQRASQTVAQAEQRATEIIADAERRAAEVIGEGRREIEEQTSAAQRQLAEVRRAVGDLQRFGSEYRERVRAAIAQQLALLDQAMDIPDVPPEVSRLADPGQPHSDVGQPDTRSVPADAGDVS